MTYQKIQVQLIFKTKKGTEGTAQTERYEFLLAGDDFQASPTKDFEGTENLLGIYLYTVGEQEGYGIQRLRSVHEFAHDRSDDVELVEGILSIRWFDSDADEDPFLITYHVNRETDAVKDEPIPDDPGTHKWQLFLKRPIDPSVQTRLLLLYIDPTVTGDRPSGPCDAEHQLVERLEAEGKKGHAYNKALLDLIDCRQRPKKKNH